MVSELYCEHPNPRLSYTRHITICDRCMIWNRLPMSWQTNFAPVEPFEVGFMSTNEQYKGP